MQHKSGTLQEAEAVAKEFNQLLTAYDFQYRFVRVITDEPADFTFPSAFTVVWKEWYIVFAEHHNPHIFHKDDIYDIYEWCVVMRQQEIPSLESYKNFLVKRKSQNLKGKALAVKRLEHKKECE